MPAGAAQADGGDDGESPFSVVEVCFVTATVQRAQDAANRLRPCSSEHQQQGGCRHCQQPGAPFTDSQDAWRTQGDRRAHAMTTIRLWARNASRN
jgi:hypothetical protein